MMLTNIDGTLDFTDENGNVLIRDTGVRIPRKDVYAWYGQAWHLLWCSASLTPQDAHDAIMNGPSKGSYRKRVLGLDWNSGSAELNFLAVPNTAHPLVTQQGTATDGPFFVLTMHEYMGRDFF